MIRKSSGNAVAVISVCLKKWKPFCIVWKIDPIRLQIVRNMDPKIKEDGNMVVSRETYGNLIRVKMLIWAQAQVRTTDKNSSNFRNAVNTKYFSLRASPKFGHPQLPTKWPDTHGPSVFWHNGGQPPAEPLLKSILTWIGHGAPTICGKHRTLLSSGSEGGNANRQDPKTMRAVFGLQKGRRSDGVSCFFWRAIGLVYKIRVSEVWQKWETKHVPQTLEMVGVCRLEPPFFSRTSWPDGSSFNHWSWLPHYRFCSVAVSVATRIDNDIWYVSTTKYGASLNATKLNMESNLSLYVACIMYSVYDVYMHMTLIHSDPSEFDLNRMKAQR